MSAATARLRAAVFARADNRCECGCLRWLGDDAQMDHALSRRVRESLQNCWALTRECHQQKTDSVGGAEVWLAKFAAHCRKHGYAGELERTESRLVFVRVRKGLAA